jgi:hypothetical protein
VFALVKALRPDHKWLEWEFSQTPQGFWNNVQNQRRFLDWAGGELGIASMEDWYKISKAQVVKLGGSPLASGRWTHYCGFLFWFFFSLAHGHYNHQAQRYLESTALLFRGVSRLCTQVISGMIGGGEMFQSDSGRPLRTGACLWNGPLHNLALIISPVGTKSSTLL